MPPSTEKRVSHQIRVMEWKADWDFSKLIRPLERAGWRRCFGLLALRETDGCGLEVEGEDWIDAQTEKKEKEWKRKKQQRIDGFSTGDRDTGQPSCSHTQLFTNWRLVRSPLLRFWMQTVFSKGHFGRGMFPNPVMWQLQDATPRHGGKCWWSSPQ